MPRFIITGCYTGAAMKGMLAKPSDREAAAKSLVEAGGGKVESFLITTGERDFSMTVTGEDVGSIIAGLMVAGAAGAVTNIQTVRAFTAAEFTEMQKKAAEMAAAYAAPGA